MHLHKSGLFFHKFFACPLYELVESFFGIYFVDNYKIPKKNYKKKCEVL